MGISQLTQGVGISSDKRRENLKLLKFNMNQADRIAQSAKLKEVPFSIHTTNGVGSIGNRFDSGFRDNDGKIIWGTHNMMVDRDTGRLIPADSDFQWMNLDESSMRSYKIVPNTKTKDGTMALFEITPEIHVRMANSTALNELRKKVADIMVRMEQLKNQGLSKDDPIMRDLRVSLTTTNSKIAHLESPYFGAAEEKKQFVKMREFSNAVVPDQIAELAMHSLKETKTHPIIAVENEPGWQMGSRPDILIDWVERSRQKFADRLVEEQGYRRGDAEKKAKELIGVTLDTGHLNTLKAQINPKTNKPWTDEELNAEVRKLAATGTKLLHIADNIGELGQDTHLMVGRGDTQNEEWLKILKENGFKGQAQFEAFTAESEFDKLGPKASLMGLGAPTYSTRPMPRFTDIGTDFSMYSMRHAAYGHVIPPIHFGMWGGPFAGLQSTFGAKTGQQKDQFSGAPTE
jgi:hypothetical protein